MLERMSPLHDRASASDLEDSVDQRIAWLRDSLQREVQDETEDERGAQLAGQARGRSARLDRVLWEASRLGRIRRLDFRLYGVAVAISLAVGWLISSQLKP